MKNKTINPPKQLWVIVDKRGQILEKAELARTSERNMVPDWPGFSFWKKKCYAEEIIRQTKSKMTKSAWDTWKFKAVKYEQNS